MYVGSLLWKLVISQSDVSDVNSIGLKLKAEFKFLIRHIYMYVG